MKDAKPAASLLQLFTSLHTAPKLAFTFNCHCLCLKQLIFTFFSNETNLLAAFQSTGCNREGRCFTAELQRGQSFSYRVAEGQVFPPWRLQKGCQRLDHQLGCSLVHKNSGLNSPPGQQDSGAKGEGRGEKLLRFIGEIRTKCRCSMLESWACSSAS